MGIEKDGREVREKCSGGYQVKSGEGKEIGKGRKDKLLEEE